MKPVPWGWFLTLNSKIKSIFPKNYFYTLFCVTCIMSPQIECKIIFRKNRLNFNFNFWPQVTLYSREAVLKQSYFSEFCTKCTAISCSKYTITVLWSNFKSIKIGHVVAELEAFTNREWTLGERESPRESDYSLLRCQCSHSRNLPSADL